VNVCASGGGIRDHIGRTRLTIFNNKNASFKSKTPNLIYLALSLVLSIIYFTPLLPICSMNESNKANDDERR
jgi:hypothetical protein